MPKRVDFDRIKLLTGVTMLRVLVACECSGRVRDAFIARRFDAWSCDIQASRVPGPHIQDRLQSSRVLSQHWDLVIAHPPCTHLCVSGAAWFHLKELDQERALNFVRFIMKIEVEHVAIENPVGIISTNIRKPDQYIQPWYFGHRETKKTGLWLKNLPTLKPTKLVLPRPDTFRDSPQSKLRSHPDRSYLRSLTYQGIADAMAEQWGNYVRK